MNREGLQNAVAVAALTPPGRGAVATVAVWGSGATDTVAALFSPASGRTLADARIGQIVFGRWAGHSGEELVVCRRADEEIEIHCHGGQAAVAAIVASMVERGCRTLSWADWVRRQTADRFTVEAVEALAKVTTLRCAAVLVDQHSGVLRNELEDCLGLLEAAGDESQVAAARRLEAMAKRGNVGRHLIEPFRVVIAGKPNVGKSSLINALAGYQRSIVFDQPGTTRDVVSVRTAIDGWPVELSDTAGLRATTDCLEAAGVELSLGRMQAADQVLLVFDASQRWTQADDELAAQWPAALVVYNKADLAAPDRSRPGLYTSATTGTGVEALLRKLAVLLVPVPPPPGAAVPFLPRHDETLQAVLRALAENDGPGAAKLLRTALKM
ncbi:MAG TPA: GTPase [Pirellulales bacterium]|nr:GTPase [Pirellulales bacterium]